MDLDWTTFLLEIINFLVLVWLLKHFLYKPVLEIVEQRRAKIESTLAEAKSTQDEADTLRATYEGRLASWSQERERAAQSLAQEMDAERAKRRAELESELTRDREKSAAAAALREADARLRLESSAIEQGAAFATRLLNSVADDTLEARLIELSIAQLEALPPERISTLRASVPENADIAVASAYPIDESRRRRIREVLARVLGSAEHLRFDQDGTLRAGIEIQIGAWSLGLNLRDELDGFARLGHGD